VSTDPGGAAEQGGERHECCVNGRNKRQVVQPTRHSRLCARTLLQRER
jgi:hypothetical protein